MLHIGVVGDFSADNETHRATNAGLDHAAAILDEDLSISWVGTEDLSSPAQVTALNEFQGLLIAPGSPYRSVEGALAAITFARTRDIPLLGTCGGFQHMVIEYAREVLGAPEAQHAEYDPYASSLFITPLSCSLAGQSTEVKLYPGSRAAEAYGGTTTTERYYCDFGINPDRRVELEEAGMLVSGVDHDGEVRVMEIAELRFFLGTLFVPQASSRPGCPHPLVRALLASAIEVESEDLVISIDEPRSKDIAILLARHLAFSHEVTPHGHVHALEIEGLLDPAVTLYSARRAGRLVGVGALRHLDETHGEIKSMHIADDARRQGVGRAMVEHLLAVAMSRGYRRVSLETGTMEAFAPARALYVSAGFAPCVPFGEYTANPHSICMTLELEPGTRSAAHS